MEKKYFLAIPILFILFSILFPIRGGRDLHFEDIKSISGSIIKEPQESVKIPYFPGKICTAYKSSPSLSVIGFLDGGLLIKEGESSYRNLVYDNPSRIKSVYSIAISSDEKYVAVIVGVDPKLLFIFYQKKGEWTLLRQDSIHGDERRGAYLEFAGDILMYEVGGTIATYSMKDASRAVMNVGEKIKAVSFDLGKDYFWVLSEKKLYTFRYNGSLISALPIKNESDYLRQTGDTITLNIDGKLYSARLVEGR